MYGNVIYNLARLSVWAVRAAAEKKAHSKAMKDPEYRRKEAGYQENVRLSQEIEAFIARAKRAGQAADLIAAETAYHACLRSDAYKKSAMAANRAADRFKRTGSEADRLAAEYAKYRCDAAFAEFQAFSNRMNLERQKLVQAFYSQRNAGPSRP